MPRALDASQYTCTRIYEAQAFRRGCRFVAGCDEAGRGALLGPLYAAAVILDPEKPIPGVDDSKKLTAAERSALAVAIRAKAIAFQVVAVQAVEVDAINVYEASRAGMIRAIHALNPTPDFILTDAMPLAARTDAAGFPIPHRAIIHGDARSVSIAAASILAKVERDARMDELDRVYPRYGLAHNKGYGTPDHFASLAEFGPCAEHRRTFQPVKDYSLPLFPFRGTSGPAA
jgi:ribonuclease HII